MAEQRNPNLTDEQKNVLFHGGTEAPGTGALLNESAEGMYTCANCGAELFASDAKFESKTPGLVGWPSFAEAASNEALTLRDDDSHDMQRTEVLCANCGVHLGHLFVGVDDHPTGEHYCINSCALDFDKK